MKKIILIPFIFLFLSLSVLAITITDNFNDNSFDTSIWNITNTTSGNITIQEANGRLEIKGNNTLGSLCTSGQAYINTYATITNGTQGQVEIDFQAITPPDNVNDHYIFGLTNKVVELNSWISAPPTYCGVIFDIKGTNIDVRKNFPSATLVTTIQAIDSDLHTLKITVGDISGERAYGVYFDGVLEATVLQDTSCANPTELKADIVACVSDSADYKLVVFDDFEIQADIVINGTGSGCEEDSECASGKCEGGFCVLKTTGEPCVSNSQCISNVCTNGKCARADMIDQIDVVKTQWFGDSENTNNLIAMFLTVGVVVIVIVNGRNMMSIVAGVIIYFGMATFFTIIGWLSPFILVLSIFGGLIGLVAMVMFKLGGE